MLEKIKSSCLYVMDNAKHVSINDEAMMQLTNKMKNIQMENWLSSSPFGLLNLPVEQIVNFLLVYEAILFSFWNSPKWSVETPEGTLDGSTALLYALLKYTQNNKTADFSKISKKEFSTILKGNIEIPLFKERWEIIKSVSQIVNDKMDGNFYEYIKHITKDDELFSLIIEFFPNFQDERIYKGETIYIYKLAQLLTSDILHIREMKEGISVSYQNLVGCADYKIPQVLRAMGILIYDKELSNRVDNHIEIKKGSTYEVEIRAGMLTVICKIEKLLMSQYNCIDINDYLYLQKNNQDLNFKPYHLTRCTNY